MNIKVLANIFYMICITDTSTKIKQTRNFVYFEHTHNKSNKKPKLFLFWIRAKSRTNERTGGILEEGGVLNILATPAITKKKANKILKITKTQHTEYQKLCNCIQQMKSFGKKCLQTKTLLLVSFYHRWNAEPTAAVIIFF